VIDDSVSCLCELMCIRYIFTISAKTELKYSNIEKEYLTDTWSLDLQLKSENFTISRIGLQTKNSLKNIEKSNVQGLDK